MTLNFPSNPANGATYPYTDPITNTVTVYTYRKDAKLWTAQTQGQEILPDLSGAPHQPSTLDERYIEKSGDNMDGTLTVNTNKIELKYDGSASFAGGEAVITGSGNFKAGDPDNDIGSVLSPEGYNFGRRDSGGAADRGYALYNGGSNPTDIVFSVSYDGSATFANQCVFGSDAISTHAVVPLNNSVLNASLSVKNSYDGVAPVIDIRDKDGFQLSEANAVIYNDGSATFAGMVDRFPCNPTNGDTGYRVKWGGPDTGDLTYVATRYNGASQAFAHYNGALAKTTATIDINGNATFSGTVIAGGNPDNGGAPGCRLWYGGAIAACRASGNSAVFSGYTEKNPISTANISAAGAARFDGGVTAPNVTFNLEPDNEANYSTTTEEYTETETYEIEVPVIQTGVGTADLVDGDERETRTVTKEREVTKTREVKTYTGPTMDVKAELLQLRETVSLMTAALQKLGVDTSAFPALE